MEQYFQKRAPACAGTYALCECHEIDSAINHQTPPQKWLLVDKVIQQQQWRIAKSSTPPTVMYDTPTIWIIETS